MTNKYETGKYESKIDPVANKNVRDDITSIRKDLSSLKTNIVGLAKDALETGSDQLEAQGKKAQRELGKLRQYGNDKMKLAEERIRDRPGQSLAIAFVAGIVTSMLFGKK